ncbi:hypothetical protein DFH09DRAFT_1046909 [Mycena vulgaris]|nr:hypothetical protein DFH09DRAFT_1046909 [Mycena vulgaris]
MPTSEQEYVELIFNASNKYAAWDPEIPVEVGDWGRIIGAEMFGLAKGVFVKDGNIYEDGRATKYGIPAPVEHVDKDADGEYWVASKNAQMVDLAAAVGISPEIVKSKVKAGYTFSSGKAAVLVMTNDSLTSVDSPGKLRLLLEEKDMKDCVLVSEVHRCASYARIITDKTSGTLAIGLSVEPPVAGGGPTADVTWAYSTASGNFKTRTNKTGTRDYYPLFRLVSLRKGGLSGSLLMQTNARLPDAVPPWAAEGCGQECGDDA